MNSKVSFIYQVASSPFKQNFYKLTYEYNAPLKLVMLEDVTYFNRGLNGEYFHHYIHIPYLMLEHEDLWNEFTQACKDHQKREEAICSSF